MKNSTISIGCWVLDVWMILVSRLVLPRRLFHGTDSSTFLGLPTTRWSMTYLVQLGWFPYHRPRSNQHLFSGTQMHLLHRTWKFHQVLPMEIQWTWSMNNASTGSTAMQTPKWQSRLLKTGCLWFWTARCCHLAIQMCSINPKCSCQNSLSP